MAVAGLGLGSLVSVWRERKGTMKAFRLLLSNCKLSNMDTCTFGVFKFSETKDDLENMRREGRLKVLATPKNKQGPYKDLYANYMKEKERDTATKEKVCFHLYFSAKFFHFCPLTFLVTMC